MANEFFTEKEYKKYYKQIKEMLINKKDKDSIHLATLVGGQPGSGKSELTKFIQAEDKNAIMIDGDFIREYHPGLQKIKSDFGTDYPKVTQPFVNRVVEQLIDELSKEKYNLIIEGTLRDMDVPLRTATMLDDRDYLVELHIIATNQALSWQSTIDRGDRMQEAGKIPRYVDKEYHDKIVSSLPETVEELAKSDVFYNVIIMRRDRTVLYDRDQTPELNPKDIMEKELSGEQVKSMNDIMNDREQAQRENLVDLDVQISQARNEIEKESTGPNREHLSLNEYMEER